MSEPTFSATTERLYSRLPGAYRQADIDQDWLLKRWLSGVVDLLGTVDTLIDRFAYVTPDAGGAADSTSDLVDPATADADWLQWLSQLIGRPWIPGMATATVREEIASALSGIKPGTRLAIAEAAKAALSGEKTVRIYPRSTSTGGGLYTGDEWDVLIVTRPDETVSDPVDAVIAAGAKPAGVSLHSDTYEADWATLEAAYTTWTGWELPWDDIESTGL